MKPFANHTTNYCVFNINETKRKLRCTLAVQCKRLICKWNEPIFHTPHGTVDIRTVCKRNALLRQPIRKMREKNPNDLLTHMNFMATNLNPLASKRLMISPTIPRWTPSGLIMIKVRSWLPAIAFAIYERNANKVQIIRRSHKLEWWRISMRFNSSALTRTTCLAIDSLTQNVYFGLYSVCCTVCTCAGVWVENVRYVSVWLVLGTSTTSFYCLCTVE